MLTFKRAWKERETNAVVVYGYLYVNSETGKVDISSNSKSYLFNMIYSGCQSVVWKDCRSKGHF